mmetsp:Transcript_32374/g.69555  ORF Transcript_32374/g.69555 Transcript_32374/m.69555 type:complete len:234 (-) Transcript_32374:19-720(-)
MPARESDNLAARLDSQPTTSVLGRVTEGDVDGDECRVAVCGHLRRIGCRVVAHNQSVEHDKLFLFQAVARCRQGEDGRPQLTPQPAARTGAAVEHVHRPALHLGNRIEGVSPLPVFATIPHAGRQHCRGVRRKCIAFVAIEDSRGRRVDERATAECNSVGPSGGSWHARRHGQVVLSEAAWRVLFITILERPPELQRCDLYGVLLEGVSGRRHRRLWENRQPQQGGSDGHQQR